MEIVRPFKVVKAHDREIEPLRDKSFISGKAFKETDLRLTMPRSPRLRPPIELSLFRISAFHHLVHA